MTRIDVAVLAAVEALMTFIIACFGTAYIQEQALGTFMWMCVSTCVYVIARLEGSGYRTWGSVVTTDPEVSSVQPSNVCGVPAEPAPEEPEAIELRDEDVLDDCFVPEGAGEGV